MISMKKEKRGRGGARVGSGRPRVDASMPKRRRITLSDDLAGAAIELARQAGATPTVSDGIRIALKTMSVSDRRRKDAITLLAITRDMASKSPTKEGWKPEFELFSGTKPLTKTQADRDNARREAEIVNNIITAIGLLGGKFVEGYTDSDF